MTQGHRFFAAVWDQMARHEGKKDKEARSRVVGGVQGKALEVGLGVGTNWLYLPEGTDYVGIEPDPYMLSRARRNAKAQGRQFELQKVSVEELPFPDDSFDTVFETLTLCTIEDVPAALAEIRRVLRPNGQFRFWDHVRPHGRISGPLADGITPAWRRIGGGCNPNRETESAISAAGFEIRELSHSKMGPMPFILGVAVVQDGETMAQPTEAAVAAGAIA